MVMSNFDLLSFLVDSYRNLNFVVRIYHLLIKKERKI